VLATATRRPKNDIYACKPNSGRSVKSRQPNEDLVAKERTMFELDNRKDQVMTICKVALAIWIRDQYFPTSYTHATWRRLLPLFQLPRAIMRDATTIQVELTPFNDHALNRDLTLLCECVNQASPHLPDGRVLSLLSVPRVAFYLRKKEPE